MSTDGPTIPTIQTDRGEWLRWDLARSLADDVTAIREELADAPGALRPGDGRRPPPARWRDDLAAHRRVPRHEARPRHGRGRRRRWLAGRGRRSSSRRSPRRRSTRLRRVRGRQRLGRLRGVRTPPRGPHRLTPKPGDRPVRRRPRPALTRQGTTGAPRWPPRRTPPPRPRPGCVAASAAPRSASRRTRRRSMTSPSRPAQKDGLGRMCKPALDRVHPGAPQGLGRAEGRGRGRAGGRSPSPRPPSPAQGAPRQGRSRAGGRRRVARPRAAPRAPGASPGPSPSGGIGARRGGTRRHTGALSRPRRERAPARHRPRRGEDG